MQNPGITLHVQPFILTITLPNQSQKVNIVENI